MSTLRVSTIQDTAGSNSSTPAAIANGIAKAWVNFNGTGAVAIRASYNVSSITDNGTGDYTLNFTNVLSDANYGFSITHLTAGSAGFGYGFTTQTASALRVRVTEGLSVLDQATVVAAIFR